MEVGKMKLYKPKKGDGIKMAIPVTIVIVLYLFFPNVGDAIYNAYNDSIVYFFVFLFICGLISLIAGIFKL